MIFICYFDIIVYFSFIIIKNFNNSINLKIVNFLKINYFLNKSKIKLIKH